MGSLRKKASRTWRSAVALWKNLNTKVLGNVVLVEEVDAQSEATTCGGEDLCMAVKIGLDTGEMVEELEDGQEDDACLSSSQSLQSVQLGMRRIKSCPRGALFSWGQVGGLKSVKSALKLNVEESRPQLDICSPRPAKRMPSASEHDSVPDIPVPLPTPRDPLSLEGVQQMVV